MKSAQAITTTISHHRSQRAATRLVQRVGFTLVELLMVILIIGILVSMLAVAINPVLQTARETTIITEMKQMDLAMESFENKYGFYPPSFRGFTRLPNLEAQLLPFLNKISPNHRENSMPMFPASGPVSASSPSRLRVWWNHYGVNLDDRGSLIFWLNGLGTNKQFPITGNLPLVGNAAQLPVIFNADLAILVDATSAVQRGEADIVGAFERETQFDFKVGQLSATLPGGGTASAGIRVYNTPHGNAKFDLAYRYRNSAFYDLPDPAGSPPSLPFAGRSLDAFYVSTRNADGTASQVFLNPNTFQISTFGLDGRVSQFVDDAGTLQVFAATAINQPSTGTPQQQAGWQEFSGDNIANFASGRVDGFDWTEGVELGNRTAQ